MNFSFCVLKHSRFLYFAFHFFAFCLASNTEKADNSKRVFAYLNKSRKIDPKIIEHLLHTHMLYQDKHNNCVFVAYDDNGKAQAGFLRGTLSVDSHKFRGDCSGSNKSYGFSITGIKKDKLYVFEAPIEVLSHATLANLIVGNPNAWKVHSRLALSGLSDTALSIYLKTHSEVKEVIFCLNNDLKGTKKVTVNGIKKTVPYNHGQKKAEELSKKYSELGYSTKIITPKFNDFNDELQEYCKKQSPSLSSKNNMAR